MNRAVFLDRDGVINEMVYNPEYGTVDSPANPDEFRLLPQAGEAIRQINESGFLAVAISNQPGIAKGKYTPDLLAKTTARMHTLLAMEGARLDAVYYCLHHPDALLEEYRVRCTCRKPKPGMLLQAAGELDIDLAQSYAVGDGITDVQAGLAAGCRTLFLSCNKCYVCAELKHLNAHPDYMPDTLLEAVKVIRHVESGDFAAIRSFVPPLSAGARRIAESL